MTSRAIPEEQLLPDSATNQQGILYNPNDDEWPLSGHGGQTLQLFQLKPYTTELFYHSIKITFFQLNQTWKAATISNRLHYFLHFCMFAARDNPIDVVTALDLKSYILHIKSTDVKERETIIKLRSLLILFTNYGIKNHTIQAKALTFIKNTIPPRAIKGESTLTWCPINGPFTDSEDSNLRNALHDAFEAGSLALDMYIMALVFRFTLFRPSTVTDLKLRHFHSHPHPDGSKSYTMDYPNETKSIGGRFLDSYLKNKPLLPEIGALIDGYIIGHKEHWKNLDCELDDLPLFIPKLVLSKTPDPIRKYHYSSTNLQHRMVDVYNRLGVITPRTGELINISMQRFRISGATWARREGASLHEVAELLGHSDLSSVSQYAAMDPAELEEIDRRMAATEQDLAGLFLGKITNKPIPEDDAIYSHDGSVVGGCKNHCTLLLPIACFTCGRFTASTSGSFNEELEKLEQDRKRIIQSTGITKLASINDPSIHALKIVIQKISKKIETKDRQPQISDAMITTQRGES